MSNWQIADILEAVCDACADRDAVVCGDTRVTFAEFDEQATRLADYFRSKGIGRGDHIGTYLYNGAEYLTTMLAAFKIAAVPININYRYVEDELRYLCDNADLKAVFFQRELANRWAHVGPSLPGIATAVCVDDGSGIDVAAGSHANTTLPLR